MKALAPLLLVLLAQDEASFPDPADCKVCLNDPAIQAKLGVVSHGDFRFASSDAELIDLMFEGEFQIHWIEGEHIKLGFADTTFRDSLLSDGSRVVGDGALLQPPFQRAHTYLERCEELYDAFLELVDLEDSAFPQLDDMGQVIALPSSGEYHGKGPHLGMAGKFEVLILPGADAVARYSRHANGLARATNNRVFLAQTDAQSLVLHLNDGYLWDDLAVWGSVAHALTHNFVRGFEHQDYPILPWLEVGLAHSVEREISHTSNSFCSNPAAHEKGYELGDWNTPVKELVRSKEKPRFERFLELEHETDFTFEDHLVAWSMTRYMIEEHPEGYAGILRHLKGLTNGKLGIGVQERRTSHADAFAKHLDMTFEEFDTAWSKWAKRQRKQR